MTKIYDGKFQRKHNQWSLNNFDDGFIEKQSGRMMVYYPIHPRANKMGYIRRAIIAYEIYHNIQVTKDYCVHHIDNDKLNDSIENLKLILFSEHSKLHHKHTGEYRKCLHCEQEFYAQKSVIQSGNGKYCSHICSNKYNGKLKTIKFKSSK